MRPFRHHRPLRPLLLAAAVLAPFMASAVPARAAERWTVSVVDPPPPRESIVPETRVPAPNGLPDGLVATRAGGDIVAAWYGGPTTRYDHGVIGDAVEASILLARAKDGAVYSYVLPRAQVFEDRTPRLADLDGDGRVEVIAIRTSLARGASVAVYGLRNEALVELAATPFIGRAHRWLNIAAIAPFRGEHGQEIAFVETPHIGGTLHLYAWAGGALSRVGMLIGFSNHRIGARELRLSAVADVDGDGRPDLALPAADRRALRIVGWRNGALANIVRVKLPAAVETAIAVSGSGSTLRFTMGLDNGRVVAVHR